MKNKDLIIALETLIAELEEYDLNEEIEFLRINGNTIKLDGNNLLYSFTNIQTDSEPHINSGAFIDLGLPSGTLWATENETNYYPFDGATEKFGDSLPTKKQWEELITLCKKEWIKNDIHITGYKFIGPNGNFIFLPAAGYCNRDGCVRGVNFYGSYWSATSKDSDHAWSFYLQSDSVYMRNDRRYDGESVRLVKNK